MTGALDWLKFMGIHKKGTGLLSKFVSGNYREAFVLILEKHISYITLFILFSCYLIFVYLNFIKSLFFCLLKHPKKKEFALCLISLCYLIILSSGAETTPRFRVPMMPYFIIVSALYLGRDINLENLDLISSDKRANN